jgi:hypothetical protein
MSSSQSSRNPRCPLKAPPGVENLIRLAQAALAVDLLLMMPIRISKLAALKRKRLVVQTAKGKRV